MGLFMARFYMTWRHPHCICDSCCRVITMIIFTSVWIIGNSLYVRGTTCFRAMARRQGQNHREIWALRVAPRCAVTFSPLSLLSYAATKNIKPHLSNLPQHLVTRFFRRLSDVLLCGISHDYRLESLLHSKLAYRSEDWNDGITLPCLGLLTVLSGATLQTCLPPAHGAGREFGAGTVHRVCMEKNLGSSPAMGIAVFSNSCGLSEGSDNSGTGMAQRLPLRLWREGPRKGRRNRERMRGTELWRSSIDPNARSLLLDSVVSPQNTPFRTPILVNSGCKALTFIDVALSQKRGLAIHRPPQAKPLRPADGKKAADVMHFIVINVRIGCHMERLPVFVTPLGSNSPCHRGTLVAPDTHVTQRLPSNGFTFTSWPLTTGLPRQ